jgi:Cysteine dioxygenase type I
MNKVVIPYPRGRDLLQPELSELVAGLTERPELWRRHVSHDPSRRVYEQLWRDEHVTAWLICWMEDHDTGFHDHDLSSGAVSVVRGQVCEERLALGRSPLVRTFGAGQTFSFAASDIHRVLHAGAEPAVTLHAYSPPLWRMGAYAVRPDGVLARHSVSYAEELRPLPAGSGVP